MILKRQKLGAFQLAKTSARTAWKWTWVRSARMKRLSAHHDQRRAAPAIPRQGARVEFGIPSSPCPVLRAIVRRAHTVPRMTQDCINTMKAMNVKIGSAAGVRSDLLKHRNCARMSSSG